MKRPLLLFITYLITDILASAVSYFILFTYRKQYIQGTPKNELAFIFKDQNFLPGIITICIFWVLLYWIAGNYKEVYRRSRLKEFFQTLSTQFFGVIIIFFTLILDDKVTNYKDYYASFAIYFSSIFILTSIARFIISTGTNNRIQNRKIWFNTLLVGSNENALELYNEMETQRKSTGNRFVGFLSVYDRPVFLVEEKLQRLGTYKEIEDVIRRENIEEVIIAVESKEHTKLEEIINSLEDLKVKIKMIPDTYDILSGQVKMESLGAPLIEIKHVDMPTWQEVLKRVFDISISAAFLILAFPIYLFTAIMVRMSSPGPIFFKQERIGLHGKKFKIIKFRSMYVNAEDAGPQLSKDGDSRITPWGKVMRKYRLDEFPQFFNVLIGEMSIVGPRPERQFFIDQIKEVAPHYRQIHRVRPGITSWGMVKFGYASNVKEMVQRLKYDIIYIENLSLLNDFKILIYTILIVLQGRGK